MELVIPMLINLLGINNSDEVIESINLLTLMQSLKFEKAVEGTKKVLALFSTNKDEKVLKAALN